MRNRLRWTTSFWSCAKWLLRADCQSVDRDGYSGQTLTRPLSRLYQWGTARGGGWIRRFSYRRIHRHARGLRVKRHCDDCRLPRTLAADWTTSTASDGFTTARWFLLPQPPSVGSRSLLHKKQSTSVGSPVDARGRRMLQKNAWWPPGAWTAAIQATALRGCLHKPF